MRSWLATTQAPAPGGRWDGGRNLSDRTLGAPDRSGDDEAVRVASSVVGSREELLCALRGVGSTMLLTTTRIVVARDGAERRPRSGVQSFPLGRIQQLGIELGTGPSGRIVVWTGELEEAVSMFFEARALERAEALVGAARPLIARRRRGIPDPARAMPRDPQP
jgi:hypothetical protein